MTGWYARPVLFVSGIDDAVDFYVHKLGFAEEWRHVDGGVALVAQVAREGCELILSCQQPAKTGKALIFVSLGAGAFDALGRDLDARGVAVESGWWGYPVRIVTDPDGNQLYFPDPGRIAG